MSANHRYENLDEMLKDGRNLFLRCSCGHRVVLPGVHLKRWFFVRRWSTRKHMIRQRFRCSRCGRRPDRMEWTWGEAGLPLFGPRDEAGWKRLLARLRG